MSSTDTVSTCPYSNTTVAPGKKNESCVDFTAFMVLTEGQKIVVFSICFVVGSLTFLENLLVLCLIFSTQYLRGKPSYLFISSLALADLFASIFFSFFFVEFHVFKNMVSTPMFLFKLGGVIMAFTGSLGSLLLTSIDRYICIHKPSEYKTIITRKNALISLAVLWTTIALISFLPLMGWNCSTLNSVCSELFPCVDETYLACWLAFVISLLVFIVYAYIHILWKAHKHAVYMEKHVIQSRSGKARMRMDIKLAKTFGVILAILVFCWSPVLSFMFVDLFSKLDNKLKMVFAFCCTLCFVNSMVNPLVYALRSKDMLHVLLGVVARCHDQATFFWSSVESDGQQKPIHPDTVCELVEVPSLTDCRKT
ncbi:cannabinoid receptor 2 [Polyodon spathula]|uniref:cannabinoid receptor 2 n=1 Tax=Polyodon spathula TaxID=7913 RepID=UPI001B7ED52A|nr:cannabinoid receptor 2 [Polyodon spathula]